LAAVAVRYSHDAAHILGCLPLSSLAASLFSQLPIAGLDPETAAWAQHTYPTQLAATLFDHADNPESLLFTPGALTGIEAPVLRELVALLVARKTGRTLIGATDGSDAPGAAAAAERERAAAERDAARTSYDPHAARTRIVGGAPALGTMVYIASDEFDRGRIACLDGARMVAVLDTFDDHFREVPLRRLHAAELDADTLQMLEPDGELLRGDDDVPTIPLYNRAGKPVEAGLS
jgi:hypothetical protein